MILIVKYLTSKGTYILKSIPEDEDSVLFSILSIIVSVIVTPVLNKIFDNILGKIVILYFWNGRPNSFHDVIFNQCGQLSPVSIYNFFWKSIVVSKSFKSYLIVDHSHNFSKFRESFPKAQRYAIIWFLIFNCGLLRRVDCFSVDLAFITQPVFQSLLVDHIWMLLLFQRTFWESQKSFLLLDDFSSWSRIPPIIKRLNPPQWENFQKVQR